MSGKSLSLSEARRAALAAQGFGAPRPGRAVNGRDITAVVRRLGLLQIDFVNVLAPAHCLVPFSRLGPYRRALFDKALYGSGGFTEQWAHEAAIIPMDTWPLLRHRMQTHRARPYFFQEFLDHHPAYVEAALEQVRREGPLSADALPDPPVERSLADTWYTTVPRATLEALFGRGVLAVTGRRTNYARIYDLAERAIPAAEYMRELSIEEQQRELVRRAARACGVATAATLADYYRMPQAATRARIEELREAGELEAVRVEGWREAAWLARGARIPNDVSAAAALLSPFDPLVWFRRRAEQLFHFHYRIEIYTPAHKRKFGYYVLPFLLEERIVARVDLKAERAQRRLLVASAHVEDHAQPGDVAGPLAAELRTLARWLELETVKVERKGGLARALAAAVRE